MNNETSDPLERLSMQAILSQMIENQAAILLEIKIARTEINALRENVASDVEAILTRCATAYLKGQKGEPI